MASPEVVSVPRTETFSLRQAKEFVQLRVDGAFTDFSLQSRNKVFKCHRVILASCSPVLKAMMMSGMAEDSKQEMKVDNISPSILLSLLDYMYTGHVNIPNEDLLATVEACDYLEILELKEYCLSKSANFIAPTNVISWSKLAENMNIDELKIRCSEILSFSMSDVSKSAEFLELNLAEVSSCVAEAEELEAYSDDLLEATMDWVSHKPNQRLDSMEDLLKKLDLLKCSLECLETEMANHEALLDSRPRVYKILTKTLTEITKQDGFRKKRVKRVAKTMIVIGRQKSESGVTDGVCWKLRPSGKFVQLCRHPHSPYNFSVCSIPNGFVITGGTDSVLCFMYLLSTLSWTELEHLPYPGYLFLVAGFQVVQTPVCYH